MVNSEHMEDKAIDGQEYFLAEVTIVETFAHLYKAIEALPKRSREVIRLALNGYNVKEIAEEMSVSTNTVKSQKRIAFQKIRESLHGLGWTDS